MHFVKRRLCFRDYVNKYIETTVLPACLWLALFIARRAGPRQSVNLLHTRHHLAVGSD
jgi:hypothetical protein